MFKKILVATDRVNFPDETVLTAAKIAGQNSARLYIMHVLESASMKNRNTVRHYQSGQEILNNAAYEKTVKKVILDNYPKLLPENEKCELKIVSGFPYLEILRYSRQIKSDLIVMGPHSSKAQEKGVIRVAGKIGSSVEGVIMRERCPVMIVNHEIPAKRLNFQKILVGIDFSESCASALKFGTSLAHASQSLIIPFHMLPVPPSPKYRQADYESDLDTAQKRLHEFCRDIAADIDYQPTAWGGAFPHMEIMKCAEKKDVDLIVMGSHTKENQGKWYTGSAVERVAFRSNCPVVVITDPKALQPIEEEFANV
jgi:nucleotide-binding universal stress UspA family protein